MGNGNGIYGYYGIYLHLENDTKVIKYGLYKEKAKFINELGYANLIDEKENVITNIKSDFELMFPHLKEKISIGVLSESDSKTDAIKAIKELIKEHIEKWGVEPYLNSFC